MKLQVLVSTMHQTDLSLVNQMNIQGHALFINQADRWEQLTKKNGEYEITMLTFPERGVGRSRNNALLRAEADICLMADDDVRFHERYEQLVIDAFSKYPQADVMVFNVPSTNPERSTAHIAADHRVRFYNFMRYGAVQFAFRRERILQANIFYSLLFGGGAKYSSGEDTLFLHECMKKGLKIIACNTEIAVVDNEQSTWFSGYHEKYFHDKGVFFAALSRWWAIPLMLQFALRRRALYKHEMTFSQAMKHMMKGYKTYGG